MVCPPLQDLELIPPTLINISDLKISKERSLLSRGSPSSGKTQESAAVSFGKYLGTTGYKPGAVRGHMKAPSLGRWGGEQPPDFRTFLPSSFSQLHRQYRRSPAPASLHLLHVRTKVCVPLTTGGQSISQDFFSLQRTEI